MKKLLALIFVIVSVIAYAQDSTKTKKTSRFFIGVNFSPDYCSGRLKDGALSVSYFKGVPKFGYTSGINICYVITKHISIETGIQYSKKDFETKTTGLTFGDTIDRRRGFVYHVNENDLYTYHYLDIPLKANFVFGKNKTRFITSVGLTTNILVKATSSFISDNYTRINFSPTVSCGIDYKINDKMFFRIEPTFRYGILKMTDTPVTQYIWNAGLNLSWYFL